jgi:hypothetical protein
MKKLMNLAIASGPFTDDFHSDYIAVATYLKQHNLDGIEMILYGDYDIEAIPKPLIIGHHLLYWPNWMDFWHRKKEVLLKDFLSEEHINDYYGFKEPEKMVSYYREEFEIAKIVKAEYMVFHVSNTNFEEIFTFTHKYESMAVLEASIELINQVFIGEGPLLLFENLMWPGLTYTDHALTRWFFDQITYENKGLLLDFAHLMATSTSVTTEEEGIAYVHQILDQMGEMTQTIKAIHLNKTIAGPYLLEEHSDLHRRFMDSTDMMERYGLIYEHISKIDSHKPFDHPGIMSIINRVNPEYLVYELAAKSIEELSELIKCQNEYVE